MDHTETSKRHRFMFPEGPSEIKFSLEIKLMPPAFQVKAKDLIWTFLFS